MTSLQFVRQRLTLVTVALLPVHAFMVTVFTKVVVGPNNPPMTMLSLWKEVVLVGICAIAMIEILSKHSYKKLYSRFDALDVCISVLVVLSLVVTFLTHSNWVLFAYGAKYVLFPLVVFKVLRRVEWSEDFMMQLKSILLLVGAIVSLYGCVVLLLPLGFFEALGYSANHSLYVVDGPIAAFQQVGATSLRRLQSTLSGPNQAALWLLVPYLTGLCMIISTPFDLRSTFKSFLQKKRTLLVVLVTAIAIVLTLSRSTWIAATAVTLALLSRRLTKAQMTRFLVGSSVLGASLIFFVMSVALNHGCVGEVYEGNPTCNATSAKLHTMIFREGSSRGHIERPLEAARIMRQHPLGLGLGMAGPASHRVTDTCVHLRPQDDPAWAKPHKHLCVFLGTQQVQPLDRACTCPVLPENWYLQIGVELGVLGFITFILFTVILLYKLAHLKANSLREIAFFSALGISIACLLLHAWEDAAVAYTFWILAAVSLPIKIKD